MVVIVIRDLIFLLGLTIMLICDYFPDFLPKITFFVISLFIIIAFLISMILENKDKYKSKEEKKKIIKLEIISLIYFILLVIILTIIGGESSITTIRVSSPFFWVTIILSAKHVYSDWTKIKS